MSRLFLKEPTYIIEFAPRGSKTWSIALWDIFITKASAKNKMKELSNSFYRNKIRHKLKLRVTECKLKLTTMRD